MTDDAEAKRGDRAPTMNDVARHAGVSLKTVSRFVNGETNIDPKLAARVRAAIGALGYRRNLAAASIRPGWTSRVLGLITSDLANPYYSTLARAVEAAAWSQGYLLTTASSEEDGERHDRAIDRLIEQRVDAILVVPPRSPGRPWSDVRPPIPPVVFLDRPADLDGAPIVLADNVGGARAATSELVANGASRVAFVGDSLDIYTMAERYAGYRDGLAQSGLDVEELLVLPGAHTSDEAERITHSLLHDGHVDAVFAANNRAAVGALRAFAGAGRRLPLIAFDDFEAATIVRPQVSVASQDVARMGTIATSIALGLLQGRPPQQRVTVVPTHLVLRGSERPD